MREMAEATATRQWRYLHIRHDSRAAVVGGKRRRRMRRSGVEYVVIVATVSGESSTPCRRPHPNIPELYTMLW